jgi:hypothetical protein
VGLFVVQHSSERAQERGDGSRWFSSPPDDPAEIAFEVDAIAQMQALSDKYDIPLNLCRCRVSPFQKNDPLNFVALSFAPVSGVGFVVAHLRPYGIGS